MSLLFTSTSHQGDLQYEEHTCNFIPDPGRLSAGSNRQQSGTLVEFSPASPSSPDTQQQTQRWWRGNHTDTG